MSAPDQREISHADIYHKLGSLEAKLDAAINNIGSYKTDLNEAFDRIRKLEDKTLWIVGVVAGLTVIVPIIVHALSNSFHIQVKPAPETVTAVYKRYTS